MVTISLEGIMVIALITLIIGLIVGVTLTRPA